MEIKNNNIITHWKTENRGKYAYLYSPTLDERKKIEDFKTKRQIYRELKLMERNLSRVYKGCITNTKITNVHIIRFLTKLGYRPYGFDILRNNLWFAKNFGSNET